MQAASQPQAAPGPNAAQRLADNTPVSSTPNSPHGTPPPHQTPTASAASSLANHTPIGGMPNSPPGSTTPTAQQLTSKGPDCSPAGHSPVVGLQLNGTPNSPLPQTPRLSPPTLTSTPAGRSPLTRINSLPPTQNSPAVQQQEGCAATITTALESPLPSDTATVAEPDDATDASAASTATEAATDASGLPAAKDILDEAGLLSEHTKKLRAVLAERVCDESWAAFTTILEDAITKVSAAVGLPAEPAEGRSRLQPNPDNPRQIQALYRRNRRRAVRLIAEGPSSLCPAPLESIEEHFRRVWSYKEANTSLLRNRARQPAASEVSMGSLTQDEVAARLRRCENTAPGSDRLTYHHWRTVDPEAAFLAAVFNICMRHRRVPTSWRESRTILIHKKGDREDPANWRPIALGCTIAKLYAGCLASRLQQWLCSNNILSGCQKGFLPHDGVFEHNFVLQERLDAARTSGGELCVAFLDFANAFGSVAHNALVDAVRGVGAGEAFSEIVGDLYRANTTSIIGETGMTEPIPISAGIRQGCPLSGLLFNLVVDPVIRAVQRGDRQHNILAYADDLTPLADDPATLQSRIDTVASLSAQLGLKLNPAKCRTLHLSGSFPVGTRPTQFRIGDTVIPSIGDFGSHSFLGRPVGFRVLPDDSTIDDAISLGKRLLNSMLAPWQRLDAVRTFLFPALNFAMRAGTVGKVEWARLDDALRPLIKRTLYLPGNASNDYVYGSAAAGAAGVPMAAELSDACRVDGAFKLLSSADAGVRDMALRAVTAVVTRRLRRPASAGDIEAYLTGETEGDFRATATQLQSVWTEARKASRRLGVTWELLEGGARISCGNVSLSPKDRTKVLRTLRTGASAARDRALHEKPSQGKTMECVAADASSSHFMRSGRFTRFADWRFVHRARLNLVPLNGARPWAPASNDQRCRVCGYQQETLPHVLCHCMTWSQAYTDRHNRIVGRVKTAALDRFTVSHENRAVGDTGLRPDLVLVKGEEAIVLDVCCPFENRLAALQEARRQKIDKYEPVRQYLLRRYQRVTVEAVIVGAVGSWDPENDRVMRRICSRSYLRLFKKLAVSDTIAASRDIYARHIAAKQ